MTETLQLRGTLRGHNGWVTQIATNPKYPDMILSSSRGKWGYVRRPLGFPIFSIKILVSFQFNIAGGFTELRFCMFARFCNCQMFIATIEVTGVEGVVISLKESFIETHFELLVWNNL